MVSGTEEQPTAVRASVPEAISFDAARFTPGAIIGDRYRMVSLLGTGGMGEVYRADDLKLGQRVALKYLPAKLSENRKTFEKLCAEVRLARQVSHPNVCRVYDMAVIEGHHFISMEFVEGEDLRSLLRRIGRLPVEKGLSIARDICAGLAAAHDRGIVHRDLKPANVMIDGRGRALIADFGLAAAAAELDRVHDFAGTPAYMAPEQLRGGTISPQTDIYALGLILYEIFTGTRLFGGESFEDIRDAHQRPKTRPGSIVKEIDPALERLILRCIDEDPALRPSSAHAVLATLPGGSAIEAALAAGETPSPEMVAAAGTSGELSVAAGWLLFTAALVSILLGAWASSQWSLSGMVPDIKSPDVLTDRARDVARAFGLPRARDEASGFERNTPYLKSLATQRDGRKWERLRSANVSPLLFRYRASPTNLVPANVEGIVTRDDPAESVQGMATIVLDHRGRLRTFRTVPPEQSSAAAARFDWGVAFAEAGLDRASFVEAPPLWTPPYGYDARLAWVGSDGGPQTAVRVEAASLAGRPVFFRVIEPWTRPASAPGQPPLGQLFFGLVTFVAFIGGAIIARRNYLRGRGDVRGALRLAAIVTAFRFLTAMFTADHVVSFANEWDVVFRAFSFALGRGVSVALLYLAIEPYVRRAWPHMLIAWSRLLAGRIRDPLVGRNVLTGAVAAGITVAISRASVPLFAPFGITSSMPLNPLDFEGTRTPIGFLATITLSVVLPILATMVILTLLVLSMLVARRYLPALLLTVAALSLAFVTGQVPVAANFVQFAIMLYVLHRFGALAYAAGAAFRTMLFSTPFTLDIGAWFAPRSILTVVMITAVLAWALHTSLAGKPLFGEPMPEHQPAAT